MHDGVKPWPVSGQPDGFTASAARASRGCAAPTTAHILEIFSGVARHELTAPDGQVLRTFHPELTDLQRQVLDLLDIPTSVYSPVTR